MSLAELEKAAPERLPLAEPATRRSASLYRIFWRWHFYAGILVAPFLIVLGATGGTYIFKDELERVIYPDLMFVKPLDTRASYDAQIEAAGASASNDYRPTRLTVPSDPTRATLVLLQAPDQPLRTVFVNPYPGVVQGELTGQSGFFRVVLDIHRRLFVGTTGRVIVELATGWTIVLMLTGLYLWWPRTRGIAGVFVPRLRARPYVVLRDLHAVAGAFLLPSR